MSARQPPFRIAVRQFEPFTRAMEREWTRFCAQEGLDLELEAVSLDLPPLFDALYAQQGLRDGVWDIAFCPTDWLALFQAEDLLLDLAPYVAAHPPPDFPAGWVPSLRQMQVFDDRILGLPYHDGPECLIYRQDLLADPQHQRAFAERFGRPLAVPRTWSEFVDAARYFHDPDAGLYGTTLAAFPDAHNTIYDFHLQLWTRNGSALTADGAVRLVSPEAAAALEFYRALINDASLMHPRARELDSVQSGLEFAAGRIALMVNWFGFAGMCETIPDSQVKGQVAIDTIPSLTGRESASLNVYWILGIARGCARPELAYRFLRHCASPAADKALTLDGGIGCRRSTWEDADVNRQIPFYRDMETLHAVARELPRLPQWHQVTGIIDELVLAVIDAPTPVAELTRNAQRRIEALSLSP